MACKRLQTEWKPLNVDPSKPYGTDEVPISKLTKREIETQLELCHTYKSFKQQYFSFGGWQDECFFPIFELPVQQKIEERIDALTMALALKNKKRSRVKISTEDDNYIHDSCKILTQLPFHPVMTPFTQEQIQSSTWPEELLLKSPTGLTECEENLC